MLKLDFLQTTAIMKEELVRSLYEKGELKPEVRIGEFGVGTVYYYFPFSNTSFFAANLYLNKANYLVPLKYVMCSFGEISHPPSIKPYCLVFVFV